MSIGGICDAPAIAGRACFPRVRGKDSEHDGVAYACLDTAAAAREARVWESEPNCVLIVMTDMEQT